MVESNIGSFTMYNTETHIFNPPDSNETYNWVDEEFKVTNWNTWMRAFSYWLRDKFDFTISSGSGSSLGLCGEVYNSSTTGFSPIIVGQDNDWNNNDEYGRYGTYPLNTDDIAIQNRCDSPFKPVKIDNKYYYCDSDELEWNGQWKNDIYDDINNRFDIILSNNNFNNLGIRIKYPITTTGVNKRGLPYTVGTNEGSSIYNYYFLNPGVVPTINNTNLTVLNYCEFNTAANGIDRYFSKEGFITLITLRGKHIYTNQYINNNNTKYQRTNLSPDTSDKIITWTPEFTSYLSNDMSNKTFLQTVYYCNTIQYYKTNNTVLNIAVINPATSEKCLEFCFYKNLDKSGGLIIAEDGNQTRGRSSTWLPINGMNYGYYGLRTEEAYGNYGNIIVSSNINQDFIPYRVKPIKYSKDIRDPSVSLIDETGLWRLENFCALPSSGTFCKDLYLVTRGGTKELITNECKYIIGNLSGKRTKFVVYPFNSQYLGERNVTDSVTFFAIPVETEE